MAKTKRIGDLLVESGLVTRLEIDQALQAQHIFGGRIGTNLIEMGVVDGETMASFLSQQYGVPRVKPEELESVQKSILDLVPAKAAHRLCILPLAMEGDQLTLAMMDPSDAQVLDRIQKNVGMKLTPKISTEVEIRFYLEKYYGVRREMRHIRLMNQILERRNRKDAPSPETDVLTSHLDRHLNPAEAIEYYFKNIESMENIPVRDGDADLTKYDLTPDGLSNLNDFFASSPFSRMTSLRAIVRLAKLGLLRFEKA
jgi:hypothetical protein